MSYCQYMVQCDFVIDRMERSAAAQRGVLTRLKNRVAAGVCPCCHRSFKQLSEHMKMKHPDYTEVKVT